MPDLWRTWENTKIEKKVEPDASDCPVRNVSHDMEVSLDGVEVRQMKPDITEDSPEQNAQCVFGNCKKRVFGPWLALRMKLQETKVNIKVWEIYFEQNVTNCELFDGHGKKLPIHNYNDVLKANRCNITALLPSVEPTALSNGP